MSGYHDHELCLAPLEGPASATLARARAFLERGYALVEDTAWAALLEVEGQGPGEYTVKESFDPTGEEVDEAIALGYGVQILQKVKLLRAHYTTMLMIVPGDRLGFIWKIESMTFDELHTWKGPGPWNQKMKTALVGWVFGLARACGAEAFVMKRDRDELRVYSLAEIRHAMLHVVEDDHPLAGSSLKGVETKDLSLAHLLQQASRTGRSKHYYTVFDHYTVADFLFPSDEPW
jgi:hypothetical protein